MTSTVSPWHVGVISNLIPAEINQFGGPQPVAIGDQDHGGIAVAPSVALGRRPQACHLTVGEILARPVGGVRLTARNCSADTWVS
jgi:hypothetical protein